VRFLRFNVVGIAGAAVQLAALWCLRNVFGIPYIVATVAAVEIAVLHNFAWHEAWTWRGLPRSGWRARLVRFHLANGVVSILSNTLLTVVFKQYAGLPLLAANLAAIAGTACLNFGLAHRWVFRRI
jgi:putative flippase GtrA